MKRPLLLAVLCAWLLTIPARGAVPQPAPDGIGALLQRFEHVVLGGDPARYLDLVDPGANAAIARAFAQTHIQPGATRAVVRERDRVELRSPTPGTRYRVTLELFVESGRRARLSTCTLDLARTPAATDGATAGWTIAAQQTLSSFGALSRLSLGQREYAARDLVVSAQDVEFHLPEGAVFTAETDDGPTALVLLGRGRLIFRPAPKTEREQMKIFAGSEALDTPFTAAFLRVSPFGLQAHIARGTMRERPLNPRDARAAQEIFREDNPKSFSVGLGDFTPDNWSLVPGPADFLAEVHTKRYNVLTYARSSHEAEDITLFDRAQRKNISVYSSQQKLAERGRFYDDDDLEDFEVVHYDIDATFDPTRQWAEAVARLTIRTRADAISALTLKLNESLVIRSVVSREFGRLVALRVRNQNTCIVNLPRQVAKGTVLGLTVAYRGPLAPQPVDREALSVEPEPRQQEEVDDRPPVLLEPSYLYSNRSYWYPQGASNSFATATLRVKVPAIYACVASGDPTPDTSIAMLKPGTADRVLTFRALQPVRYLSVLITRLLPVRSAATAGDVVRTGGLEPPSGVYYGGVDLAAFASPRMRSRVQAMADRAADILQFYGSLLDDFPYPSLTLAVVERELPGGHSPGYLAVVAQPVASTRYSWRSDPTSFENFPDFFLAHEIAHQWWGQAVGWKNYHEQWLSEGLAQYFAAMYAERVRGKEVFGGIIRRLQEWSIKKSSEGPVYLGYRIGHVKHDPQLFRAIVYNKSAAVLHMLRRLLGDDAFFRGLRRFYFEWRFRKGGSDDLRRAFEEESGRSLERFFDRWIYDSRLPRLKFSSKIERDAQSGRNVAVVRFEQVGELFDVPVTVTLDYADKPSADVVVAVTEAVTEARIPLAGKLRGIDVNRDQAAVARIEK